MIVKPVRLVQVADARFKIGEPQINLIAFYLYLYLYLYIDYDRRQFTNKMITMHRGAHTKTSGHSQASLRSLSGLPTGL